MIYLYIDYRAELIQWFWLVCINVFLFENFSHSVSVLWEFWIKLVWLIFGTGKKDGIFAVPNLDKRERSRSLENWMRKERVLKKRFKIYIKTFGVLRNSLYFCNPKSREAGAE